MSTITIRIERGGNWHSRTVPKARWREAILHTIAIYSGGGLGLRWLSTKGLDPWKPPLPIKGG